MGWQIVIGLVFGVFIAIIPAIISNKIAELTDPNISEVEKRELKIGIGNWLIINTWAVVLYGAIFTVWLCSEIAKVDNEQNERINEIELKAGLNPFPAKPDTLDINKAIIENYDTRAEDTK